jgi:hypothetical protein
MWALAEPYIANVLSQKVEGSCILNSIYLYFSFKKKKLPNNLILTHPSVIPGGKVVTWAFYNERGRGA